MNGRMLRCDGKIDHVSRLHDLEVYVVLVSMRLFLNGRESVEMSCPISFSLLVDRLKLLIQP